MFPPNALESLDHDHRSFVANLGSLMRCSASRANLLQRRNVFRHFSSSLLTLGHGPSVFFMTTALAPEICQMELGLAVLPAEPQLRDLTSAALHSATGATCGPSAVERAGYINKLERRLVTAIGDRPFN